MNDAADLWAILMRGEPAVDAQNDALLRVVDPSTELCTDAALNNWRPQYYGDGQPLACTGAFDWRVEALHERPLNYTVLPFLNRARGYRRL